MKIGLVISLHGERDTPEAFAPTWENVLSQAQAAEAAGFDLVVLEDALLYRSGERKIGYWEAVSMAAALAAATSTIGISHSVLNTPYRSPALVAKIAETLDEISGGRYTLGIGAGNTPHDYGPFGFSADMRYSRFVEAIEIIHALLRQGFVDFHGDYQSAPQAELVLRGPRPQGPPIGIAAGGPKMIRLACRYGDEWNWWSTGTGDDHEALRRRVDDVARACGELDRDPATLRRSLDFYSVDPLGGYAAEHPDAEHLPIGGSSDQIASALLAFAAMGFDEIRCDLWHSKSTNSMLDTVEAMTPVVAAVHEG